MSDDTFIQFPLCALALDLPAEELVGPIISYGLVEAGIAALRQLDDEQRQEAAEQYGLKQSQRNSLELACHLAAPILEITLGTPSVSIEGHDRLKQHVEAWKSSTASVRIRKSECFEVRDGSGRMSLREFRVLCAIFSAIGAKPFPVVISQKIIGVRAIGCLSDKDVTRAKKAKLRLPAPLTPKQLRLTVEKLHELKWFARVTPDPHGRATYYSNRMSEDEMREKLFKTRTYKAAFRAEQREKDRALSERIQEAKGTFNSKSEKGTFNSSDSEGHREGSAEAPEGHREGQQEGHREGTYNRNSLNRNPPNTNPLNTNPLNKNSLSESPRAFKASPSEEEFVAECKALGVPLSFARDKFHYQAAKGWPKNWRAVAQRVRLWHEKNKGKAGEFNSAAILTEKPPPEEEQERLRAKWRENMQGAGDSRVSVDVQEEGLQKEEKKQLAPPKLQWTAFIAERHPHFGDFIPAWEHAPSVHDEYRQWAVEKGLQ